MKEKKEYLKLYANLEAHPKIKMLATQLGYRSITEFLDALSRAHPSDLEFLKVVKVFNR